MKKTPAVLAVMLLCIFTLSGCRLHSLFKFIPVPFSYDHAEQYKSGGAELSEPIKEVRIDWLNGNVNILPQKGETIAFSEKANRTLNRNNSLYYWVDGSTLNIQFCRSGVSKLNHLEKDLTIAIPEHMFPERITTDTVSASVYMNDIRSQEVSTNTVSGAISLSNCAVSDTLCLDSTSGSIQADLSDRSDTIRCGSVSGSVSVSTPGVNDFRTDTTSGSVRLTSDRAPTEVDIDSVSGSITLILPNDIDATLDFDTVSGSMSSSISCVQEGSKYIFGDGSGRYRVDTTSGSLKIQTLE